MDKLLLVFGGASPENEISVLTALKVYEELVKGGNEPSLCYIDLDNNFYYGDSLKEIKNYKDKIHFIKGEFFIKKNKYYFGKIKEKYRFDYAYILGHGKEIEDGTLASYFQIRKFPYLYDELSSASLFQDKIKSKLIFKSLKINVLPYKELHRYNEKDVKLNFNYPIIVKPNSLGSSIGINLVKKEKDLTLALKEAFIYDEDVIIEKALMNKEEYNIALMGYEGKEFISSIEKVNDNDKVLSFFDKYDYSSTNEKRIINPPLEEKIKEKIIKYSKLIKDKFNLCGIYRYDYILDKDTNELYLNEINVLPGSLAYYLFEEKDIKFLDLIIFDITLKKKKYLQRNARKKDFEVGFIKKIDIQSSKNRLYFYI